MSALNRLDPQSVRLTRHAAQRWGQRWGQRCRRLDVLGSLRRAELVSFAEANRANHPNRVVWAGNTACYLDRPAGVLWIVDVTDAMAPRVVTVFRTPSARKWGACRAEAW